MRIINDNCIDNAVECFICTNPMRSDTGCNGECQVDKNLAENIYGIIDSMTVKCETNLDFLKALFPGTRLEFDGIKAQWTLIVKGTHKVWISSRFYDWLNEPYDPDGPIPENPFELDVKEGNK